MTIKYEWDENKNQANCHKHGVPFELVYDLDWSTVIEIEDTRKDHGETRFSAYGIIDQRLFNLVYTQRRNTFRVISLRKANSREVRNYEQET